MKRNHIPNQVQAKLDKFAQQVEQRAKQVATTQTSVDNARTRLGGDFERDSEYNDRRRVLDKLVADKPKFESTLRDAEYALADAKAWLDGLPDDAELVLVAATKPNGYDLAGVQSRINAAEDEMAKLRAVPVQSPDIADRIREYVSALARPKISGIASGQQLKVTWPDEVSVLALLLPDQMTNALLKEIDRLANLPMPLSQQRWVSGPFETTPDQPAGRLSAERGGQNAAALALLLGIRARPSRGCAFSGSGGLSVANRIADMEVQQRTSAEPSGTLRHQVRAARA